MKTTGILLCCASCLGAQQPAKTLRLSAGDEVLRIASITPRVDTFELSIREGENTRRLFTVRTQVIATSHGTEPAWLLVQEYESAQQLHRDSSFVAGTTLAPLAYHYVGAEEHILTFAENRVSGSVIRGDSSIRVDQRDTVGFLNAVADPLLFMALPLRVDLEVSYRTFNPPNTFTDARLHVVSDSTLVHHGNAVPVWRVSYDAGAAPTTIWLEKGTGRIVQSVTRLANGSEFWRIRSKS